MSVSNIRVNTTAFAAAPNPAIDHAVGAARSFFARIGAFLAHGAERRECSYEEAYLAESSDRYDLEFRMRELARANPQPYWMTGLGR
ncbi:hypothetical protein AAKU55_000315 [Oxalobacteraceae bacterium GrIS 1.11]